MAVPLQLLVPASAEQRLEPGFFYLSQSATSGSYDLASCIDFDKVVIGDVNVAIRLRSFEFLLVELIRSLFDAIFLAVELADACFLNIKRSC